MSIKAATLRAMRTVDCTQGPLMDYRRAFFILPAVNCQTHRTFTTMLNRSRICTNLSEFTDARVVTFLNPYSLLKIIESGTDLHKFDKLCIDGVALKMFLGWVYRDKNIQRLSFDFTSVANGFFKRAADASEKGFILGSDEQSNATFLTKISSMYPGLSVEGRSGYFNGDEDLSNYLENLAKTDFDFVIIGMGAVKQEEVANALVDFGFKGRIYTCGGFIHQTAMSGGKYYPWLVNKLQLRFAYRMFKEPTTVRRYLLDYPRAFLLLSRNIHKFTH